MVDKVGFIGLGLIGGSLAKAIKKNKLANEIIAYDLDVNSLATAYKNNIIDEYTESINERFNGCDIIFLCCPVYYNIEAFKILSAIIDNDCIITDVSSTKENIMNQIYKISSSAIFIGGHPMTGSEKSGYDSSKAHLFENAYYIITPLENTEKKYIDKLTNLIIDIKALPIVIDPHEHDYVTGTISHIPHIIASLLVNLVNDLDTNNKYMHTLAAGGFKDITRIASSSPIMWQQICTSNKDNINSILNHIKKYIDVIQCNINLNDKDAILEFFERAHNYRESFEEKASGPLIKSYSLTVDVIDEPGIIATIATILSKHSINIKNIGIINSREYTNGALEIIFYDKNSQEKSLNILKDLNYIVNKR